MEEAKSPVGSLYGAISVSEDTTKLRLKQPDCYYNSRNSARQRSLHAGDTTHLIEGWQTKNVGSLQIVGELFFQLLQLAMSKYKRHFYCCLLRNCIVGSVSLSNFADKLSQTIISVFLCKILDYLLSILIEIDYFCYSLKHYKHLKQKHEKIVTTTLFVSEKCDKVLTKR